MYPRTTKFSKVTIKQLSFAICLHTKCLNFKDREKNREVNCRFKRLSSSSSASTNAQGPCLRSYQRSPLYRKALLWFDQAISPVLLGIADNIHTQKQNMLLLKSCKNPNSSTESRWCLIISPQRGKHPRQTHWDNWSQLAEHPIQDYPKLSW